MNFLTGAPLTHISRRQFLQRSAAGLLGLFWPPIANGVLRLPAYLNPTPGLPCLGRALEEPVTLYDQPSLTAKPVGALHRDDVTTIQESVLGDREPVHNRIWYQVTGDVYAHSALLQPVEDRSNPVERNFSSKGRLAEVTVPFTSAVLDYRQPEKTYFRLYYGATFWVTSSAENPAGQFWYRISDDTLNNLVYFVRAEHLHLVTADEVAPISPQVPAAQKRLEIRLEEQLVIAYEGSSPVMMARTATGQPYPQKDLRTPIGTYDTGYKLPARHMFHDPIYGKDTSDLPGVPWVTFITAEGVAFHGTYWHNDYGKPRSHGCINLPIPAARWLYRWCLPSVPVNERILISKVATRVDIF